MLRNYLLIAVRNILKHKGYSAINILGLAIGIACFVLIGLYVQDELSYDRQHKNADRIYRVVEKIEGAEESSSAPFPVSGHLLRNFPDYVQSSTRFFNMQSPSVSISYSPDGGDQVRFSERHFFFTDSTVFDVFDFPVLRGNPAKGLNVPNVIMVTESTAKRYFGDDDPIGKTLQLEGQFPISLEVVGVLADSPRNAHFQFDMLASLATLNQFSPNGEFQGGNWYWNPCWTYVLLAPNVKPAQLEAQFPKVIDENFPDQIKEVTTMWLQPLTDIHLTSKLDYEIGPNSDISYVYIFSIIAVFVLLIACINFMNLSTARSTQRAKEVGVRKSVGAGRRQLIRQFLGESMISAFIAAAVSVPIVLTALPALNAVADKDLWVHLAGNPWLWSTLIIVPIVVGAFSGLYPAFFLSAFDPAEVLKGTLNSTRANVAVWLRRGLVSLQFVISMVLIAGTIVAYQQLDYLRNKNLGFNKEEVVFVPILLTQFPQRYEAFRAEAEKYPNIKSVTMVEDVPGSKYQTNNYVPEGMNDQLQVPRLVVHDDFVKTFGMTLAAGRGYSREFPADTAQSVMINMALVRQLGWGTAEDALGRTLSFFGGPGGARPRTVIGVLNDFHYASLRQPVGAFVVERYSSRQQTNFFGRYLALRVTPDDVPGTLAYLKTLWERYETQRAFEYFFLDERLDAQYKGEATLGKVATTFSILAIFVACLGLFGMASFTAERRTKEIGVRKVMGASVPAIILLLSRESIHLVALAFVVAAPVCWFVVKSWLDSFSYHIDVGIVPMIAAGLTVLFISWFTVSAQSLKAASVQPAESLKYE